MLNHWIGKKHTEESKRKMREARMKFLARGGKPWNKDLEGAINSGSYKKGHIGLREEKNGHWKGNEVGYIGLHDWVRKNLGTPDTCEHCNKSGLTRQQIHWANKSQEYKRELNDWLRLCTSCHKKYDLVYGEKLSIN